MSRFVRYSWIDRLLQVQGPNPETFVHDPAGNLLGSDEASARSTQIDGNRLLFQGDTHYRYDAHGNRIEQRRGKDGKQITRFEYDALNQLIAVNTGKQRTEYAYDALGRRIAKRSEQSTTEFLWNGDVLLSETTTAETANSSTKTQTKTYLFEPGSFKPLAFVENRQLYHYHLDHLGTPQEITHGRGKIVWGVSYRAYGSVALAHEQMVENNLRFQGQYFDEESGLHYNRFRYYDPQVGRFINQDPIGLLGGTNNYRYVPNPVAWIDPNGLICKEGYIPDFDAFEVGQGFSGAYDPITDTVLLIPSRTGPINDLPEGFVPRGGGHTWLREVMRSDGFDVSQLRGFSATKNADGSFHLDFISGQLNQTIPGTVGRELAKAERPAIEKAFEAATSRIISNPGL